MDKNNLVELTNKVYKLTLLFPKKEPLRYKIREVADDILAYNSSSKKLQENLGILKKYFEVAKWQNWVSYFDILEIEKKYDKIESDLLETVEKPAFPVKRGESVFVKDLDNRKEKILEILKEKERIQVWEVNEILSDVSKRTLRRDFEQLLKQGLVERIGERNNTFYQLK
jgi:DNA-binding transcriptional ArsR family regulator